ncbi:unnamed protein product [Nezara viridula]|uniref:Leucine-rich melanocyte differentiation-associated protein-like n=1 Tax=Nezara viridula TaxID=85310 RepID=A0A9P0HQ28_NEZVI|nr:unnamed protein product [Nezara viridula]
MIADDSRLNLAHQNLRSVPKTLVNSFQDVVKIIDVSNNSISDVSFLRSFKNLTSIILDHNNIMSDAVFPYLPSVRILWLNYNQITTYSDFIKHLRSKFPHLKQLSLMGNPGIPQCLEETYYDYLRYRLYVISCFEDLEYLDDRTVSEHEKEEAQRLFGTPVFEKYVSKSIPKVFRVAVNRVQQFITPSSDERPYLI